MTDLPSETPSPESAARREAMLDDLLEVLRLTQHRRRQRRRMLVTVACIGLAGVLIRFAFTGGVDSPGLTEITTNGPGIPINVQEPLRVRRSPGCQTLIVQTHSSALERYRAKPRRRVMRIDDRTLLATLALMGRPAELIHEGDRPRLSTPVTDAELRLED